MIKRLSAILAWMSLVSFAAAPARAEEGMWTFDAFPRSQVAVSYGVVVEQPLLDHLRLASVRLTSGCSGAVVSREGLVATNHHCVVDCVQNVSAPGRDFVRDGFLTAGRTDERKCAGMQAEILIGITDITAQVAAAVKDKTGEDFLLAREAATEAGERAGCGTDSRLRCQTIPFFRGGQYKVYKYRRYDDVRLVFAPEFAVAFFGGDPDNFNFPRHNLDCAFLRLYDNGQPAQTPEHLRWSGAIPADGELMLVSGNPGATERQLTVSQLETLRDLVIPVSQLQRSELRGRLITFAGQSDESRRIATDALFNVENTFKVFFGRQFALNDDLVMAGRRAAEANLRARVAANPALQAEIGDPWGDIEEAQKAYAEQYIVYRQLEAAAGFGSELFDYARTIVRGAVERPKPSDQRLPEFSDARLALVEKGLFDEAPVDPPLERMFLEFWLSKTREYLTTDALASQVLLGRESPEAMAARLVNGSRLANPAYRRALWDGGLPAVIASDDPLVQFVLTMDPLARVTRRNWEDKVTGPIERASERIARARFAIYGDTAYPDATFTLRISYGKVAGWTERGSPVAPFTTLGGLFDRATGADPYALPPRWLDAKGRMDLTTVLNFTTTNDIIGGNSGSPVVNVRGEVVGLAFDGNIHSLGGSYFYDSDLNRTIVVSTASVSEALRKVYGREALLRELMGG
ncbi:MAG: S46 family peptidase [Caulobacteraceae bacterium]